jgi:hypothetical protein
MVESEQATHGGSTVRIGLPDVLVPAAVVVSVWVAVAADRVLTGVLPGVVVAASAICGYVLWRRRGTPWHDPVVIVSFLPALAGALWIGVGGLVLGVDRSTAGRLLVEVGPGLALTGLVATLISYHGRHRP